MPQEILETRNVSELLSSMAGGVSHEFKGNLSEDEITHILRICRGFWMHSGDPEDSHVELTAGDCSNGFVNVLQALQYPVICDRLAYEMACRIRQEMAKLGISDLSPITDWAIGSDHASATFSQNVARYLGLRHDFTEKGPDKTQVWQRFVIEENARALQVEELMTTSATTMRVREGIRKGNPHPVNFFPFVAVLVHRSSTTEIEGDPVIHVVHYDIEKWSPAECSLCARGSRRVKPKAIWDQLVS